MLLFQPPCSEAYNPRLSFRSKSKEHLNERRAGLSSIWRHSFVTQICKMEFLQQQASVRPIPEKVEVDDMTLPQHYLKGTRMCYTKIDGLQGVVVEIKLGRPLFSTFLTVSSTNLLKHQSTKTNFSCRSIFPLGCLSS